MRNRLANTGTTIDFAGPADLAAFTAKEIARFRVIVAASGVDAE